jgi:hypothetical protein
LSVGGLALAQDEPPQSVPPSEETGSMAGRADHGQSVQPAAPAAAVPDLPAFQNTLDRLNRAAQVTVMDLGALQIERWRANRTQKQEAQDKAESLQRNLTAAVPELTQKALSAPGDIAPSFRLYRNLNALYDVLASVAESASEFGPKDRYTRLAADVTEIDTIRRSLADRVDNLAVKRDSELASLRAQAQTVSSTATPVKKTVVDDTKPVKPTKKKTTTKPATTSSGDPNQRQ